MRICSLLASVLGVTLGLIAVTPAIRAQGTHGNTRHLHGVVESESGKPVRDAEVVATWAGGRPVGGRALPPVMRTRSDGYGRFDFRDLPADLVTVRVRALGFAPLEQRVDLRAADRLLTLHLETNVTTLQDVQVRSTSVPEQMARVAATSTLDGAALATGRGQTLGETIKQLPGVTVIQFGPSIAKPVIRGLASQRVLVMNGGLRQEDQQWGTEHAPNIDSFTADAVTVVRGAATVLYGADALGGVVRVDQAALPDTGHLRGDAALNLFSNSRQGAVSLGAEGADLVLPKIGATGYRVRLTSRVAGNAAAPDYHLTNTGFRELNGSLALGVARAWGRSDLTVSRFGTELGVLRQAHVGNADDLARSMSGVPPDSAFSYAIGRPNQRVTHTTLRSRTTWNLPNDQELEVLYGLQFNHRREYDNHGPLRFRDEPAFNLKLFTNTLDVRWRHARWKGWRGTIGTSGMAQGNQTLGKAFLIPGYDLWQGAVYLQEEYARGRWSLQGGLRGDAISQTTLAFADYGIRSPAGTRRWSNMAGSFGVAYLLRDGLDLSVRAARAWRPPTVNERYAQGVHHGTAQYELGSAALDPEVSRGIETTLRYGGSMLQLEAAAYANRVDGFIFLQPTDPVLTIRGTFPGFRYAQVPARMRGGEIAMTISPSAHVQLLASGTLVRGTSTVDDTPLYDMPADRMTVTWRTHGTHTTTGAWYIDLGTQRVRRQNRVPQGIVYALPTAGYSLWQIEAGARAFRLGARSVTMSLSVHNALNARYRDYLSRYRLFVNDVGRDVALRITMPF